MKKNFLRGLVAVMLALVLCTQMATPITTEAASKKKKVTASTSDNTEKMPSVKKGTTTVKVSNKKNSYYKFTAKKAGTYVLTVSNVKGVDDSDDTAYGYIAVGVKKDGTLSFIGTDYATEGGTRNVFNLCSKTYYNQYMTDSSVDLVEQYLTKRTVTIKLKKGQTIYICNDFNFMSGSGKIKYTLKIKMKK